MTGPMSGFRVLEVANYLAAPSAAALMADMGAEVIKVEPPGGDPWRDVRRDLEFDFKFPLNYGFELDNRGKRSIALNLEKEEAREVAGRLADRADVFLTNLLPRRMERYRLRYEDLSPRNPRLVYLAFNGYGPQGPERDRLGYDHTAFWASSGIMSLFSQPGQPPIDLQGGMGDHSTAPMLLAGVLAALLERERTGKGQRITTSLFNMGLWAIGTDVQDTLVAGKAPHRYPRTSPLDPLYNTFQTGDGKWFILVMHATKANWGKVCRAFGREEMSDDPRLQTFEGRMEHAEEIVAEWDRATASYTMDELAARMDAEGIIWAPNRSLLDAIDHPQARINEFFTTLQHPKAGPYRTLNTPLHFDGGRVGPKGPAPEVGQHTQEILEELGLTSSDIEGLRQAGAIP